MSLVKWDNLKPLIVIQSRISSARLPAKALLPICDIPSVLLAGLRAGNTGYDVVVATSDQVNDNSVALTVAKGGLKFFRGPLDDVLKRFFLATSNLNDQDIIVRLTADNIFPDGNFIQSLIKQFLEEDCQYLATSSPTDGLPYGLSGEVFTAGLLREADKNADSEFDREHVTPWMRRNSKASIFKLDFVSPSWSKLRCTLDNIEDYFRLLDVFAKIDDPIHVPWTELVTILEETSHYKGIRCPFKVHNDGTIHSELTLGTVQLGLEYGVANTIGIPSPTDSKRFLELAVDAGVTSFDTARAYGDSEKKIGELISQSLREQVRVITKLDPMSDLPLAGMQISVLRKLVDESVFHSCHNLKLQKIDTLLLHRWAHYKIYDGEIWLRLLELKKAGLIQKLGVSVYDPWEAIEALKDHDISHIQIPINIFDWRWREQSFLDAVKARPDVIWHARSVYLQGLVFLSPEHWPKIPGVHTCNLLKQLDDFVIRFNRLDRADLCISYIRSLPWITSLVLGMESSNQLDQNLRMFQQPKLNMLHQEEINQKLPKVHPDLLNPAVWKNYQ